MLKNKNTLILVLAVLILAIAVFIVWGGKNISFQRPYYAVYLRTGDMYFGHLCRFPRLALTDVYFLQQTQNEGKVGLILQKFEQAAFAPENKMELSRSNVVWVARLQANSQVVQFIEGRSSLVGSSDSQSIPSVISPVSIPAPESR